MGSGMCDYEYHFESAGAKLTKVCVILSKHASLIFLYMYSGTCSYCY